MEILWTLDTILFNVIEKNSNSEYTKFNVEYGYYTNVYKCRGKFVAMLNDLGVVIYCIKNSRVPLFNSLAEAKEYHKRFGKMGVQMHIYPCTILDNGA